MMRTGRLVLAALLLGALAIACYLWWTPGPFTTDGPVANDFPVVIRTNGGLLEVATVKVRRTFNLTQYRTLFGRRIPFCAETASYTVDTDTTYRVRLAKSWRADYANRRLAVTAPKLEPALPVAFDTSTLAATLSKCMLAPDLKTETDLLRGMSRDLERNARSAQYRAFAREHGARDTVREFVRKWLLTQRGHDVPANTPIDVTFADER